MIDIIRQSFFERRLGRKTKKSGSSGFRGFQINSSEHIREINKHSFQNRKAENPEHIREIRRHCRLRNTIRNSHKSAEAAESFQNAQNMSAPISDDSNGLQIQTKSNKGVASMINSFHQNIQCMWSRIYMYML